MFREHVCHVQACSGNTLEQFPSVFSEKSANYEAFCQMRKKIQNLSIKITRQQKILKTVSVHYKNTDLILKMIKKAKISRVRVPLNNFCRFPNRYKYTCTRVAKWFCFPSKAPTLSANFFLKLFLNMHSKLLRYSDLKIIPCIVRI